ncbi:MAG: signal peptidase I [Planctomycetaceae bacterium]|nr:MAG: signal peptidase I [Planctomycetaceae bacterium]
MKPGPKPTPEKSNVEPRGKSVVEASRTPGNSSGPEVAAAPRRQESWRETIESIVVAFVLAFLFRTFEAEAFVIPTGSMAPTLYGQHRDIVCEHCGTRFAVGASTGRAQDAEVRDRRIEPRERLRFAVCPNSACQFPNDVVDREIFAGDRILVNKFPYEFSDPARWDVVVFKFPEEAKTNYIKRLVGLPGEEIRLRKGDVWVRRLGSDDPWRIARKSPEKQSHLELLVHDNDNPARPLLAAGWPESWQPAEGDSHWQSDLEARTFRVDPAADDARRWEWLRYSHFVPQAGDWTAALRDEAIPRPRPQLIRDFYAYNARITANQVHLMTLSGGLPSLGSPPEHWVSDLTLSCEITVDSPAGELMLELVEGPRRYRCQFDLKAGTGQLFYPHELERAGADSDDDARDVVRLKSEFDSRLTVGRSHGVRFANVDDRLCLWVDGVLVQSVELDLDEGAEYQAQSPSSLEETDLDRQPIGIAARGATVRVSHLAVHRDIYYTDDNIQGRSEPEFRLTDSSDDSLDEFLMLGDNSPRSNDSRLWRESHAVPRRLLIGKAFCIYWPHAMPFLNQGRGFPVMKYEERGNPDAPKIPSLSVPFYPQIGRMKRIW